MDALSVVAHAVVAHAALVLRLPMPPLLLWLVITASGGATVLSYAVLAEAFPKEVASRANAALNVLHIGGAFAIQSGIGVAVGLWNMDAAGHASAAAYTAAFGGNLLPQVLALAWFVLAPHAAARPALAAGEA